MKLKRLSILLTIFSLILLSYSISQMELSYGFYGLSLHSFPISYPISLAMLVIASFIFCLSKHSDYKIALLPLFIFIFSIWLLPMFLEPEGLITPGGSICYGCSGLSYYIAQTGHFNTEIEGHQMVCPAPWILPAAIFQVCGLERPHLFGMLLPWLYTALYFFSLFPLFRRNLEGNLWLGALWIFFIGNFIGYEHFTAYGFSYLLYLPFIYLLTKVEDWERASMGTRAMFIILLASAVIYHGLLSTLFLFLLIAFCFVKGIKFQSLALISAVFIGTWAIYLAWTDIQDRLPVIVDRLLRFDIMYYEAYEIRGPRYIEGMRFRFYVKLYTIIAFLALGAFGALLTFSEKFFERGKKFFHRFSTEEKTFIALSLGIIAHGIIVGLTYHAEFLQRFYLNLLPCVGYFGAKLLNKRALTLLLLLFLILAVPLHLIGRNCFRTESLMPYDIAAQHFFHDHVTAGECRIISCYHGPVAGYLPDITLHNGGYLFDQLSWNDKTSSLTLIDKTKPFYAFLGEIEREDYKGFGRLPFILQVEDYLNNARNGGLIYTNGGEKVNIYAFESFLAGGKG